MIIIQVNETSDTEWKDATNRHIRQTILAVVCISNGKRQEENEHTTGKRRGQGKEETKTKTKAGQDGKKIILCHVPTEFL